MKYTYLLLDFFTVIVPLVVSFNRRIYFRAEWKYFVPANLIVAFLFLLWDYDFTKCGIWQFNDEYITGIKAFGLPLEEILFFIVVPYSCTFIYAVISNFIKKSSTTQFNYIFAALGFISAVCTFYFFHLAYTCSVLILMAVLFISGSLAIDGGVLRNFSLTYFISLLPMALMNGLLTGLPVVIYNNAQNTSVRIGTIPVEDFGYSAILLFSNIVMYEIIKNGLPWLLATAKRNRQKYF